MKTNKHIVMWACSRSRSSVISRAFEQLDGCVLYDEALQGPYLSIRGYSLVDDAIFDREKVSNRNLEMDYHNVIEKITGDLPEENFFSFHKSIIDDYCYWPDLGIDWVKKVTNFFLIRNPKESLLSYSRAIESLGIQRGELTGEMIGTKSLFRIFKEVEAITEKTPLVIHSDDVVKNPRQTLQWLCDYLGIAFDEKMLVWEGLKNSAILNTSSLYKNPDSEPWYATLRNSQTFLPYEKKYIDWPDELMPELEKCMPYYEKLLQHRQVFDWSD